MTRAPTSDQLFDNKNWKIANQILKGLCVTRPSSWARKIRDITTCQMSKKKKSNEIYKMQETPSCSVFEETREQNCKLPEAKFKKGVKLGGYMIFKQYF